MGTSSGSDDNEDTSKRSKTVVTFHAHRIKLQDDAPVLAELSKAGSRGEGITTVSITDLTHDVFKHVLFYAYGGKITEDDMRNQTQKKSLMPRISTVLSTSS